jgi:glycosyltransferase involved in cell wall biosynthesis
MRNWERLAWTRADRLIVCSEHDRRQCEGLRAGVNAAVVPNVVDVREYNPKPEGPGATILYIGGMDWFPNRDAVKFFVFRVLPGLTRRFPGVKFLVAGRAPDAQFRALFAGHNVSFTGSVPDVRPSLAQADICVVPLRIGSGTRLKILEAAAAGKAIVSTRIGAEGLDFVNGKEILLADSEQDFVDAVSGLLANPGIRSSLGYAARARVEIQYDYGAARAAIRRVLTGSELAATIP